LICRVKGESDPRNHTNLKIRFVVSCIFVDAFSGLENESSMDQSPNEVFAPAPKKGPPKAAALKMILSGSDSENES